MLFSTFEYRITALDIGFYILRTQTLKQDHQLFHRQPPTAAYVNTPEKRDMFIHQSIR